jgi:maltose phosphorylase
MSVVKGFGGMTIKDGKLNLNPYTPDQWKSYSFRLEFRGRVLKIKVSKEKTETILESGSPLDIVLNGKILSVK